MKHNYMQQVLTEDQEQMRDMLADVTAQRGVVEVLAVVEDWLRDHHEDVEDHLSLNGDERFLLRDVALNARYKRPGAAKRRLKPILPSSHVVQSPPSEAADQPSRGAVQDPQGATSDVAPRRGDRPTVIVTVELGPDGERGRSRRIRYELEL